MCLKTYDTSPWPSLISENYVSMTPFKRPTSDERVAMSPLMHTKYLITRYHVSGKKYIPQGQLSRYIICFPKALHTSYK